MLLNTRLQEPSLGLVRTIQQTQKDFQTNNAVACNVSTAVSLGDRKSSPERTIRDMLYKKTEVSQISSTFMTVTSCVTQCWNCPCCKAFDMASAEIGAERNPQKTEVIHHVSDLDSSCLENQRSSPFGLCRHSSPWKHHTRSCGGTPSVCHRPAPCTSRRHPGHA